jgi:hypothetical protein
MMIICSSSIYFLLWCILLTVEFDKAESFSMTELPARRRQITFRLEHVPRLEEANDGVDRGTAELNSPKSDAARRSMLLQTVAAAAVVFGGGSQREPFLLRPPSANADFGPIKIMLTPTSYFAKPCPPEKPIPGMKVRAFFYQLFTCAVYDGPY